MVRAGDIKQFTLDGREYDVKGDSAVTIRLSGVNNENSLTGNGGLHTKQSVKAGGFEGMPISINTSRQDLEELQTIANSGEQVAMAITLRNGVVYAGQLAIEGDVDYDTSEGQAEISAMGPRFEQI